MFKPFRELLSMDDSTAKRSGGKRKNLIYSAHVQKKHETPTTRIDQRRQ